MNENRYIKLTEKYLANEITKAELEELNSILSKDKKLKEEFEEQKKVKEILRKMELKNPSQEIWDAYWLSVYNRIERGLAWILISIASIILLSYAALQEIDRLLADTTTPTIIKYAIFAFILGAVILLVSLLREKIFTLKKDKYKEIQR